MGARQGGKNAIWKLTVDFEMPSKDPALGVKLKRAAVYRQHCTLGSVPAGELNQVTCTGVISDCLHISVASSLPCCHLAIASPPLSPAIAIIATAIVP